MRKETSNERLTQIATSWTLIHQAHHSDEENLADARRALFDRYAGAIYRYLLGATRDEEAANELLQEIAVRFARGAFHRVTPKRGLFRYYLKTTLTNITNDFRKKSHRYQQSDLLSDRLEVSTSEDEDPFDENWRQDLIARAWESLARIEQMGRQPLYTVLKLHTEEPKIGSAQLANCLTTQLKPDKPFTDVYVRKLLQRARTRLADLLLDEVASSLGGATPDELEEELASLGLLRYCRDAMERRRSQ